MFNERSAKALTDEQASRGRLYSFDYDHRSIMPGESPEAGRAAGYHRLEVRTDPDGKPELWASSCEWTDEARAGLESDPPAWRYFSPCYVRDEKTGEVVSYVNCALTNTPLTHGIPALASAAGRLPVVRQKVRALVARSQRTRVKASRRATSVAAGALSTKPATPEELLAALAVLRKPSASEHDKSKALDLLADHFSRMIEAEEDKQTSAAKLASARARVTALTARAGKIEAAIAARSARIQSGSGLQPGDTRDPFAFTLDSIVGCARRNRGALPAEIRNGPLPRRPPPPRAPSDPVIARIEQAARNSGAGRQ